MQSRLGVSQGHSKCHHSMERMWLPIDILYGCISCRLWDIQCRKMFDSPIVPQHFRTVSWSSSSSSLSYSYHASGRRRRSYVQTISAVLLATTCVFKRLRTVSRYFVMCLPLARLPFILPAKHKFSLPCLLIRCPRNPSCLSILLSSALSVYQLYPYFDMGTVSFYL